MKRKPSYHRGLWLYLGDPATNMLTDQNWLLDRFCVIMWEFRFHKDYDQVGKSAIEGTIGFSDN